MNFTQIRAGRLTLCAIVVTWVSLSHAPATIAAERPDDVASTVAHTTAELDEVIVSGRLDKLSEVQKAIVVAEDRAYSRYNELNKQSMFDINCFIEAPTGTRMMARHCEAQYITDAKSQAVQDLLQGHAPALRSSTDIINTHLSDMRRRMREAAEKDPEMLRALVEYSLLVERYKMLRKKKFEGRTFVWD